MAGSDNVQFNTLERALSGDINDLQSMAAREMSEILREMFVKRSFALGALPGESPRSVIIGGLEVSPSGSDIAVATGALAQENSTLLPVPGALDSSYRLGLNRSIETLTGPVPGVETFFLLEAQMANVVTSNQLRDIFNPATNLFTPTPVDKLVERQIDFQFVAGVAGNAPVPSGDPWVPVAIVRRPGGGGAVLASDLMDVRALWDAEAPVRDSLATVSNILSVRGDRFMLTSSMPATPSNAVIIDAETFNLPTRLWHSRGGGLDVTAATVLSPGVVLAADTWFYLYLVPWQGLPVVDPRDPLATGRGLLVLSDVAPLTQGSAKNSAVIPLPPPFGVASLPAAHGVVVAALRRNPTNTGWLTSWSLDENEMRIAPIAAASTAALAENVRFTVNFGAFLPRTAKTVRVQITQPGGGSANGANAPVATAWLPVGAGSVVDAYATRNLDRKGGVHWVTDLPVAAVQSFDFVWTWLTAPVATTDPSLQVDIIGWSE